MEPTTKGIEELAKVEEGTSLDEIQRKLKQLALSDIESERRELAGKLKENLMKIPKFRAIGEALGGITALSDDKKFKSRLNELARPAQLKPLLAIGETFAKLQGISEEMMSLRNGIEAALLETDLEKRSELIARVEKEGERGNYVAKWSTALEEANSRLAKINTKLLSESDKKRIHDLHSLGNQIKQGFVGLKITATVDTRKRLEDLKQKVDDYSKGWMHYIKSALSTMTFGLYGYKKDFERGQKWIEAALKTTKDANISPLEVKDEIKVRKTLDKVGKKEGWRQKFKEMAESESEEKVTPTKR